MIFTLEALEAKYGDALLLHYGSWADPRLVVIDGGPGGVFNGSLKPRLEQIADLLGVAAPLPVRLAMVSHIDGDHIQGIIELFRHMRDAANPVADVEGLWHNHFDDFLRTAQIQALGRFGSSTGAQAASAGADGFDLAVAAGVAQGRRLRDLADAVAVAMNAGTKKLRGFVSAGDKVTLGPRPSIQLQVLGPAREQLKGLQGKWDASLASLARFSPQEQRAKIAAFVDESIANISSIVALAKMSGKTILLTGDARGDFILKAIGRARLFKSGKFKVDVLKVPHHGSDRNVTRGFFEKIPAKHYVISGNRAKSHGTNPDVDAIRMITSARGAARYTMHFTYKLKPITDFIARDRRENNRNYQVEFPPAGDRSVWVDLGSDPLDF